MYQNNYYYVQSYVQQHRQELMQEAEQMRMAKSAREADHTDRAARNLFSQLLMAISFRLRPAKQIQAQPKAITSHL